MTRIRSSNSPVPQGTGRKLNVHEVFCRHPGYLLNVLRTLKLRPMSKRRVLHKKCPCSELSLSAFSRIQTKCGKTQTRIRPNTDNFYAVIVRSKYENVVLCTAICQAKILNPKIKNPYVYRSIEI